MQLDFLVALRFPSYSIPIYFFKRAAISRPTGRSSWGGEGNAHKDAVFSPWRNLQARQGQGRGSLPSLGLPTSSSADGFLPLPPTFSFHCPRFGLIKVQRLPWLLEFPPEIGNRWPGRSQASGLPRPPLYACQGLGDPGSARCRRCAAGCSGDQNHRPAWAGPPGWLHKSLEGGHTLTQAPCSPKALAD